MATACISFGMVANAQVSGSAKPVQGAILIKPGDISADDAPSEFLVFVGNVQANEPAGMRHLKQTFSDVERTNIPVKDWISLGGLVAKATGSLVGPLDGLESTLKGQGRNWHAVLGAEASGTDGKIDELAVNGWVGWMKKAGWIGAPLSSGANYSYTSGKNRMIALDTTRSVNLVWLGGELKSAQADKAIERIFVMGWRPLVEPLGHTYDASTSDFFAEEATKKAAQALVSHDKVVGYFCSNPSVLGLTQLATGSEKMQVIIGNGGGALNSSWVASKHASYGFSVVIVYKSGFVGLVPFDRPLPDETGVKAATSKGQIKLWSRPVPVKK